jgi:hypothetical protein
MISVGDLIFLFIKTDTITGSPDCPADCCESNHVQILIMWHKSFTPFPVLIFTGWPAISLNHLSYQTPDVFS